MIGEYPNDWVSCDNCGTRYHASSQYPHHCNSVPIGAVVAVGALSVSSTLRGITLKIGLVLFVVGFACLWLPEASKSDQVASLVLLSLFLGALLIVFSWIAAVFAFVGRIIARDWRET